MRRVGRQGRRQMDDDVAHHVAETSRMRQEIEQDHSSCRIADSRIFPSYIGTIQMEVDAAGSVKFERGSGDPRILERSIVQLSRVGEVWICNPRVEYVAVPSTFRRSEMEAANPVVCNRRSYVDVDDRVARRLCSYRNLPMALGVGDRRCGIDIELDTAVSDDIDPYTWLRQPGQVLDDGPFEC